MSFNRFQTVNDIVNSTARRVGLTPVADVLASNDKSFVQLVGLLNEAMESLAQMYPWGNLNRQFSYTIGSAESGPLTLPQDFNYMIDQTGWERRENVPLLGPLSAQEWAYLLGRDLLSSTIYASFRFDQNALYIYPDDPMPEGAQINFEYSSRNFFQEAGSSPVTYSDIALNSADIVQLPPDLVIKFLRYLFLDAKGFDTVSADNTFKLAFESWSGKDNGAPVINAGLARGYPFLDAYRNTPDSGYGTG